MTSRVAASAAASCAASCTALCVALCSAFCAELCVALSVTRRAALCTALCVALLPGACAGVPTAHIGPVTAISADGAAVGSCSQAGIELDGRFLGSPFRPAGLDMVGDQLLVGGGEPAQSGEVAVLHRDGTVVARRRVGDDMVYAVAIRSDGKVALFGNADGTAHLVALPGLEPIRELVRHTAPCRAVCFAADGATWASAGLDGLVYLYQGDAPPIDIKDHTAGVECLLFRGDRLYSGARDGKVRIHRGGRLLRTYQGLGEAVVALSATPDGSAVVVGLQDGRILKLDENDATFRAVATIDAPLFSLEAAGGHLFAGTVDRVVRR